MSDAVGGGLIVLALWLVLLALFVWRLVMNPSHRRCSVCGSQTDIRDLDEDEMCPTCRHDMHKLTPGGSVP